MAPKKAHPVVIASTLEPERARDAISTQLASLQAMKAKNYLEVGQEEKEWRNFTESLLEMSFGKPSTTMDNFYKACSAGNHRFLVVGEPVPHNEYQRNFVMRLSAFEALLKACLSQLDLRIPKKELLGHYEPGQQYEFYRDLKGVLALARAEVIIVDPYLGLDIFDIYAGGIARTTALRILTDRVRPDVMVVAQKYAAGGNLELRTSAQIHDRLIFIDDRVWLIGQSIKDAATNKPTYIVEHNASVMKSTYREVWASATPII